MVPRKSISLRVRTNAGPARMGELVVGSLTPSTMVGFEATPPGRRGLALLRRLLKGESPVTRVERNLRRTTPLSITLRPSVS